MRLPIAILGLIFASSFAISAENTKGEVFTSEGQKIKYEVLLDQQSVIWGFDFLPDHKIIFTTRDGAIKIFDQDKKTLVNVTGAPAVWAQGQGGLLDIRVHPKNPSKIYLTYSKEKGKEASTAVAMATLKNNALTELKDIFVGNNYSDGPLQFGSRIEFDNKGYIFVTIGERNDRDFSQKLSHHHGKVIRLKEDGSVPTDNPFAKVPGAKPEIWSLGLRNPEGLVIDPRNGDLWADDFGPLGGDELNLIKPGANYGWPVITYGREYSGPKIGEGTKKEGMEQPIVYWVPSISPAGISLYLGDAFPKWKGNMFLGALSGMQIRRVVLDGHKVVKQEPLLQEIGQRFRNLRQGTDGYLYISTDSGILARLVPNP